MDKTLNQYIKAVAECRQVFENKMKDYGAAWRILRLPSITDQIFIKATRIRNLEINSEQKIDEGIRPEYIGIYNYSLIAIIQIELESETGIVYSVQEILTRYDALSERARILMENKNHDYSEVWRDMRLSSLTDIILMKILRIKQIEDNKGHTDFSEGLEANYLDIMNYAVFALIKIMESELKN